MNIPYSLGFLRHFCIMLKRRTSKRFVLGEENTQQPSFDDDEPTEVIPNLTQKFQMTLQADPEEGNPEREENVYPDNRLLRVTKTLQ